MGWENKQGEWILDFTASQYVQSKKDCKWRQKWSEFRVYLLADCRDTGLSVNVKLLPLLEQQSGELGTVREEPGGGGVN